MSKEALSFAPFVSNGKPIEQPKLDRVRSIIEATGFLDENPDVNDCCLGLRGSMASLLPPDGELIFRSPYSDFDFFAIRPEMSIPARYDLMQVNINNPKSRRDVNILSFTPERMERELRSNLRIFLSTKLLQVGFALQGTEVYGYWKDRAIARMIQKGAEIATVDRVTPSGAARLALQSELYVEPWRRVSFQTAFVQSGYAQRNRFLVSKNCERALDLLASSDKASRVSNNEAKTGEPIYELDINGIPQRNQTHRVRSVLGFVLDQGIIIYFSRNPFSISEIKGLILKLRAVILNPTLSYDLLTIFE